MSALESNRAGSTAWSVGAGGAVHSYRRSGRPHQGQDLSKDLEEERLLSILGGQGGQGTPGETLGYGRSSPRSFGALWDSTLGVFSEDSSRGANVQILSFLVKKSRFLLLGEAPSICLGSTFSLWVLWSLVTLCLLL